MEKLLQKLRRRIGVVAESVEAAAVRKRLVRDKDRSTRTVVGRTEELLKADRAPDWRDRVPVDLRRTNGVAPRAPSTPVSWDGCEFQIYFTGR